MAATASEEEKEDKAEGELQGKEEHSKQRQERAILQGLAANAAAWLLVHFADFIYDTFFEEHEEYEEEDGHRRLSGYYGDANRAWYMNPGKLHNFYNKAVLVSCIVVLVLCALARLRVGGKTWGIQLAACAFFSLMMWPFPLTVPSSLAKFMADDAEKYHFADDSTLGFFRAVIIAMSFGLTVPLNATHSRVILCIAFLSIIASCMIWQIGEGEELMLGILGVMAAFGFSFYGAALRADVVRRAKQAEEQVHELAERHEATRSLLSHFCDCVVKLGPDFTLLDASPQLATFLFRRSIPAGAQFRDHLATEEERARFTSAVESAVGTDDKPQREALAIPVCFKDSAGREVGAHIHLVHERTPDGGSGYLVGVAEMAGRSGAGAGQATDGGVDSVAELPLLVPRGSGNAMSDAASSAGDSASSAGESTSTTGTANPVQVDITLTPSMQVGYTSPAFQAAFGVAQLPKSFSHWLEDPDSFSTWLQTQREDVIAGATLFPAKREYGFASVRCSGTGTCHKMWLSALMPDPSLQKSSGDAKGFVESGNYRVSIRLDPPTGNAARRGQRRLRRARGSAAGARQGTLGGRSAATSPAASPAAAGGRHMSL